jgi:phage/plasmid-associated DNA primase
VLEPGVHAVEVPEGAAWGGLFDPECEPPLLIGAFRVLDGPQEIRVVRRPAGPYLEGEGVLELLGPREFDRALKEIAAAGLSLPEPEQYQPPFPLWWARVDPVPVPPEEDRGGAMEEDEGEYVSAVMERPLPEPPAGMAQIPGSGPAPDPEPVPVVKAPIRASGKSLVSKVTGEPVAVPGLGRLAGDLRVLIPNGGQEVAVALYAKDPRTSAETQLVAVPLGRLVEDGAALEQFYPKWREELPDLLELAAERAEGEGLIGPAESLRGALRELGPRFTPPPPGASLEERIVWCSRLDLLTWKLSEISEIPESELWKRWGFTHATKRAGYFLKFVAWCGFEFARLRTEEDTYDLYIIDRNVLDPEPTKIFRLFSADPVNSYDNKEFKRAFLEDKIPDAGAALGVLQGTYTHHDVNPIEYLNVENGVLDLRTLELKRPEEVDALFTYRLNVAVDPEVIRRMREGRGRDAYRITENAVFRHFIARFCEPAQNDKGREYLDCTNWNYFVDAIGVWLMPVRERLFMFLVGEPRSGKTTLMIALASALGLEVERGAGKSNLHSGGLVAFTTVSQIGDRFGKAGLLGKDIVLGDENLVERIDFLDAFNQLFGQSGEFMVERKFKDPVHRPAMKTGAFVMNNVPIMKAASEVFRAFMDRLTIVVTHLPDPEAGRLACLSQEALADPIEMLHRRISRREAFEFLLWARIQLGRRAKYDDSGGLVGLNIRRYGEKERTDLLLDMSSSLPKFRRECLEERPGSEVKGTDLYDAYVAWVRRSDQVSEVMKIKTFYTNMVALGLKRGTDSRANVVVFRDVRLRPDCAGGAGGWHAEAPGR